MPRLAPTVAVFAAAMALATCPAALAVATATAPVAPTTTKAVAEGRPPARATLKQGTTFVVNTAATPEAVKAAAAGVLKLGGVVTASWPQIGVVVGAAPDKVAPTAVTALRRTKGISSVGISGRIVSARPRPAVQHATPLTGPEVLNPNVTSSHAVQANAHATGAGVTVAVVDAGTFEEHQDLGGRVDTRLSGSCADGGAFDRSPGAWRPPTLDDAHGTMTASVVGGAADGVGMRGIAPGARLTAIRVGDDEGNMYPESAICAAMVTALQGIPIANHSYGVDFAGRLSHGFWDPADQDQAAAITAVSKAFAWSRAHGTLNIAAAGNSGEDISDKPHIPLASSDGRLRLTPAMKALLPDLPSVMTVSESDPDTTITFQSVVGLGQISLSAVGVGDYAGRPGELRHEGGTSFAAPAVAGAAALVKQLRPTATPDQLQAILQRSARARSCQGAGGIASEQPCRTGKDGLTSFFGHGQLDALAAVQSARS